MDWPALLDRFLRARKTPAWRSVEPELDSAAVELASLSVDDINWTVGLLDDRDRKWFVARVAADVWDRRAELLLRTFVDNTDIDVRRGAFPQLSLDPARWPERLRPLLAQAIEIARAHPDDCLRQRLAVALGQSQLLPCLPHRATD